MFGSILSRKARLMPGVLYVSEVFLTMVVLLT